MRILKFNVEGQIITIDPSCDFSDLVPGTKGYLKADFSFSSDWNGFAKTARFYSLMGKPYPSCELKDGRSCVIPSVALERRSFKVQITGAKAGTEMITNKELVVQAGGMK